MPMGWRSSPLGLRKGPRGRRGPGADSGESDGTVIVAVIAVGMMQMPVDEVADVIAVWDRGVTAVGSVHVVGVMAIAFVGATAIGIRVGDFDGMLVVVIFVRAVQVSVVQIADVIAVLDGDVAAVRTMLVIVVLVDSVCHFQSPPEGSVLICRVGMFDNVPHEVFHVSIRQSIKHVATIAPALYEILVKEDSQSL